MIDNLLNRIINLMCDGSYYSIKEISLLVGCSQLNVLRVLNDNRLRFELGVKLIKKAHEHSCYYKLVAINVAKWAR